MQISFAQAEYDKKKKRTRREVFLEKMEQVVPWSRLLEVIEPFYPKSGKRGRPYHCWTKYIRSIRSRPRGGRPRLPLLG